MSWVAVVISTLLHYTRLFWVWITTPIFRALYEKRRANIPAPQSQLVMKSAVELAQMIREKEVTSVDVLRAFIQHTNRVNPVVNAVVANRFVDAISEARAIDELLRSESPLPEEYSVERKPFLGVPFTTKEAMAVKGLCNASGLLARKDYMAPKDADSVAAFRAAGAIPIAVTNVSELCMWYESSNLVNGRTENAYHQGRTVGGSSGGEGCLISAAGSVIGIGSDIGGSIRMPAFFNGIFGHKPTTGVTSNTGQFPDAKAEGATFLSTGPMCRYAGDLLPLLKVMAKPEEKAQLRLDEEVDLKKLRYFYQEDDGGSFLISAVDPQIKQAIKKAVEHLESLSGGTATRTKLSKLKHSLAMWSTMMQTSGEESFCSQMGNSVKVVNPTVELVRWLIGLRRHTLPAIMLGVVEKPWAQPSLEMQQKLRDMTAALRNEFTELLGGDGVFLYPTHPIPAPYHNQPLLHTFNWAYTAIFNVLGLPSTAVPMGLSKEGVPIGLQVVGALFSDRLTIAVARELEHQFGGWVPPFAHTS